MCSRTLGMSISSFPIDQKPRAQAVSSYFTQALGPEPLVPDIAAAYAKSMGGLHLGLRLRQVASTSGNAPKAATRAKGPLAGDFDFAPVREVAALQAGRISSRGRWDGWC